MAQYYLQLLRRNWRQFMTVCFMTKLLLFGLGLLSFVSIFSHLSDEIYSLAKDFVQTRGRWKTSEVRGSLSWEGPIGSFPTQNWVFITSVPVPSLQANTEQGAQCVPSVKASLPLHSTGWWGRAQAACIQTLMLPLTAVWPWASYLTSLYQTRENNSKYLPNINRIIVIIKCIDKVLPNVWVSLVAQLVKNPPAMQETWVSSLGWEDPLEKGNGLENSMDCIVHGVAKSWTRLSDFHFSLSKCLA